MMGTDVPVVAVAPTSFHPALLQLGNSRLFCQEGLSSAHDDAEALLSPRHSKIGETDMSLLSLAVPRVHHDV